LEWELEQSRIRIRSRDRMDEFARDEGMDGYCTINSSQALQGAYIHICWNGHTDTDTDIDADTENTEVTQENPRTSDTDLDIW
jgi:hypothetical protein